ncbi:MAG TPA: hypothetical protein VHL53_00460 [Acidimicrobiia bacterium]|nr:hypothetical protein [Acidimicrobiia bacterium]
MSPSRMWLAGAAAVAAVVLGAGPALAHEEINPKTFPTGQPTYLTLNAANEEAVALTKVVLHAPAGVGFGENTRSPAGWTVNRTDDTITWSGGTIKPSTFEQFGYEIEGADQPGTLAYKITLAFADGKTDDVEVDVTATAPTGPGSATTGPTVTTGAAPATTAPPGEKSGSSDSSSGTAKAALAIAIIALIVAAGALAVGGRRRGPAGPAGGGGGAGGAAQDW